MTLLIFILCFTKASDNTSIFSLIHTVLTCVRACVCACVHEWHSHRGWL